MAKKKTNRWYAREVLSFMKKTDHLSLAAMGAYDRMLDWYYANERPLPAEVMQVHRICKAIASHEQTDVQAVLTEFFVLQSDGWHNLRADEELLRRSELSVKRENAANNRWHNSDASASVLHGIVHPTITITDSPLSNDKGVAKPKTKGSDRGQKFKDYRAGIRAFDEGRLPKSWGDYAINNFGWSADQVRYVFAGFTEYWDSADAKQPVKKDWSSAWQGWCRRANSRGEHVIRQAGAGRGHGYSIAAAADQALSDTTQRPEGRDERLTRLGILPDPSDV